jgi:division protein CdvB (Snf7/Vps24/ESCRT-III family)
MDGQCSKQKCAAGAKLAEIRMVSQQSETKTVVVEVHQSEEVDDSVATSKRTPTLERLKADEVRDKINHRCYAALIMVLHFPTLSVTA